MKLSRKTITNWPKLAWVASIFDGASEVEVLCGPMVEQSANWIVEGVWPEGFESGNFDRTDLIFGTGIRLREDHVIFVSSGTPFDRLSYCRRDGRLFVSNSLPALLAVTNQSLQVDYDYEQRVAIFWGEGVYTRTLKTDLGNIDQVYFKNLVYSARGLNEVEKPDTAPCFDDFATYRAYLTTVARGLGENLSSGARTTRVNPIVTISSGYDSPAAAVVARLAGCDSSVSIGQATSVWRGSDSGAPIAQFLGMDCTVYNRQGRDYPHEEAVWAATGDSSVLNWTQFDFPAGATLLFAGSAGDAVWNLPRREAIGQIRLPTRFEIGLTEYRLIQGFFHCDVAFWGARRVREIHAISHSEEMKPWLVGPRNYVRPIPRRIVEEAGVPRGTFATRKRNTTLSPDFRWPYSAAAQESFATFLRSEGFTAPSLGQISFLRTATSLDRVIYVNITRKLGFGARWLPYLRHPGCKLLFQWGNYDLKENYQAPLRCMRHDETACHFEVGYRQNEGRTELTQSR